MDTEAIKEFNDLLKTIKDLKTPALWFLVFAILIATGIFILIRILRQKKEEERLKRAAAREKLESDRAKTLHDDMTKLSQLISLQMERENNRGIKRDEVLAHLTDTLNMNQEYVMTMLSRQDGKINKINSERVVRSKFKEIRLAICFIIERSLIENNFETQKAYIIRRVSTEIAKVLSDAENDLELLDLSIPFHKFFLKTINQDIERFVLVDSIWNKVEILYRQETHIKQRIEESRLMIDNVINDYLNKIDRSLNNEKKKT